MTDMKRKILLIALLTAVIIACLCLIGCKENPVNEGNGIFVNVELDGNIAEVEVVRAEDGIFDILSFSYTLDDVISSSEQLIQDIQTNFSSYVESNPNINDFSSRNGEYTYLNNDFVINRMALVYSDGQKEYCYLDFNDYSFEISPKFTSVLLYALIGFCITFVVLIFLMGVIKLISFSVEKLTSLKEKKKTAKGIEEAVKEEERPAPGSAGELVLKDVSERDAAMIMAIVADELKAPLNTLRFISITDVTESEDK